MTKSTSKGFWPRGLYSRLWHHKEHAASSTTAKPAASASSPSDAIAHSQESSEENSRHANLTEGSPSQEHTVDGLLSEARAVSSDVSGKQSSNPSLALSNRDPQSNANDNSVQLATTNAQLTLAMSPESNWDSSSDYEPEVAWSATPNRPEKRRHQDDSPGSATDPPKKKDDVPNKH